MNDPPAIRKRVEFELRQHAQAQRVLRRWEIIGLHTVRVLILLGLLMAWMWVGDLVLAETMKASRLPMPIRSWREMLPGLLPYSVWLPLGIWAWYRVRQAARRTWLERVQASGIHDVEYSAKGVKYWSDAATHFYRWDSFSRVVDRPQVMVLKLNRAIAVLLPKIEMSPAETAQVLAWKQAFPGGNTMPEENQAPGEGAAELSTQLNYHDYVNAIRMERKASAKWKYQVAAWVRISMLAMVTLVFVAMGILGYMKGERGLYWYWSTFGLPVFLLLIYLWSWSFVVISRRILWRDVRLSMSRPQRLVMDDRGIVVCSETWAHHYTWGAFNNVEVGKRLIMLGVIGGAPVFIPRRQIPGNEVALLAFCRHRIMNVTHSFPVEMSEMPG